MARKILTPSCWIHCADNRVLDKSSMDVFRITAWTLDPSAIPMDVPLFITEDEVPIVYDDPINQRIFGNLPPCPRQKKLLSYEVLIHLRSVADFSSRTPSSSPSPPSSDGDSGPDGNPDCDHGISHGQGPRIEGFHCSHGVSDGAGFAPSGVASGGGAPVAPTWARSSGRTPLPHVT